MPELRLNRTLFFDRHAPDWQEAARPDMPLRLERVVREAGVPAGARVLDLGTGTGVLVPHLLRAIGKDGIVVALDVSWGMLRVARGKGFPAAVLLLRGDAQCLAVGSSSFDAVLCNAALPHFPDRQGALREMARVLRPGGVLVVSHPIGRDAVNRLHQAAGGAVGEDRVPPAGHLGAWLRDVGLTETCRTDEPEFYLVAGRKPGS